MPYQPSPDHEDGPFAGRSRRDETAKGRAYCTLALRSPCGNSGWFPETREERLAAWTKCQRSTMKPYTLRCS